MPSSTAVWQGGLEFSVNQDDHKFTGDDLPLSKIERAVNLSQEKYCGVSEMLREKVELTFDIILEKP